MNYEECCLGRSGERRLFLGLDIHPGPDQGRTAVVGLVPVREQVDEFATEEV